MVAESVKVFLDGQFWLDPEVFQPDQVAFARRMDVEHVNYCSSTAVGKGRRSAMS
jgi:hypothetical protein